MQNFEQRFCYTSRFPAGILTDSVGKTVQYGKIFVQKDGCMDV